MGFRPGPVIVRSISIKYCPEVKLMVSPASQGANTMSSPGCAKLSIICLNEPAPPSLKFVTVRVSDRESGACKTRIKGTIMRHNINDILIFIYIKYLLCEYRNIFIIKASHIIPSYHNMYA